MVNKSAADVEGRITLKIFFARIEKPKNLPDAEIGRGFKEGLTWSGGSLF